MTHSTEWAWVLRRPGQVHFGVCPTEADARAAAMPGATVGPKHEILNPRWCLAGIDRVEWYLDWSPDSPRTKLQAWADEVAYLSFEVEQRQSTLRKLLAARPDEGQL